MSDAVKKTWQDHGREWLDTLVVAISVAMAFRAYFYEPFNIPTGSMQPTLYGNHSEACEEPGVWQTTPLKWLNWLVSGRDYKEFVAPFDGVVGYGERNDGRCTLYVQGATGQRSAPVTVPTDLALLQVRPPDVTDPENWGFYPVQGRICAVRRTADGLSAPDVKELRVKKGDVIWRGYDTTGDFIFVNRWKWNFRAPARGDVMVFSTTGVGAIGPNEAYRARPYAGADGKAYKLQQGTHYIKRLTALPNETVEIVKPDVLIDGVAVEPIKPMEGKRGEKTPLPNAGGPNGMKGPVKLGADEYFACGDNSDNSLDSRYWGPVPERNLKGTGAIVFWPIINPRWGSIK